LPRRVGKRPIPAIHLSIATLWCSPPLQTFVAIAPSGPIPTIHTEAMVLRSDYKCAERQHGIQMGGDATITNDRSTLRVFQDISKKKRLEVEK
jgi:hypothetical protein